MIRKKSINILSTLLTIILIFSVMVSAAVLPSYRYNYWSDGQFLSYPIYNFYITGKYYLKKNTIKECFMRGCVYYTPSSGIIPSTGEVWEDKPKVSGDLAFVIIPNVTGIKTSSYTVFHSGDKIALEVQSDAEGNVEAIILSKKDGKWVEISKELAENDPAIVEYDIKNGDKEIAVVAKLNITNANTGNEESDSVVFLIDVDSRNFHISLKTIGVGTLGIIAILTIIKILSKKKINI